MCGDCVYVEHSGYAAGTRGKGRGALCSILFRGSPDWYLLVGDNEGTLEVLRQVEGAVV